jgi:preprotein translocase subunit YajC
MLIEYPLKVIAIVLIVAITGLVYLLANRRERAQKDENSPN